MRKPLTYKTSRDYARLRELLDAGYQVVCFTTYYDLLENNDDCEPHTITDICYGSKHSDGTYGFGVRGNRYDDYDPSYHKFSFDDFCGKKLNLEFIDINNDIEKTARVSVGALSTFGDSTYILDVELTPEEQHRVGFISGVPTGNINIAIKTKR